MSTHTNTGHFMKSSWPLWVFPDRLDWQTPANLHIFEVFKLWGYRSIYVYIYTHIHVQHKQQFRCLFEETESDWPVPHDRKATVAPIFAHYNRGMPTICEGTRATSEQMGRIGARSRWVPPQFPKNSKLWGDNFPELNFNLSSLFCFVFPSLIRGAVYFLQARNNEGIDNGGDSPRHQQHLGACWSRRHQVFGQ